MRRELLECLKPYQREYYIAIFCTFTETVLQLFVPLVMANIVDEGIQSGDLNYILGQGAIMIGISLLALVLGRTAARYAAFTGIGFGAALRQKCFDKIQSLSFNQIDWFKTGSLITRMTTDVTAVQTTFVMSIRMLVRAPVMLITALVLSMMVSIKLSLVFFVSMPVLIIAVVALIARVRPLFTQMQERMDAMNTTIQEDLSGIRVVKSFTREEHEIEKFDERNQLLRSTTEQALNHMVIAMPMVQFLTFGTTIGILWVGGVEIFGGRLLVGQLTTVLAYVNQIMFSMIMLSMLVINLSRALASLKRIMEVVQTQPVIVDGKLAETAKIHDGEIIFRDVSFKYHETSPECVLEDINLQIPAGQTVGILGGTGSGKSTLVQLIPRLYDVSDGQILVSGTDVRDFSLRELRSKISMVLQKNALFSGTIAENLRLGNPDATDEELHWALKVSGAFDFVMGFKGNLDYEVEQEGSNLSGGQKQRLCIARALLTYPEILILDDSTSAVDVTTENSILEALNTQLKDMTKLIIAQRISSIMHADQILVLDRGKIESVGTHEQLLKDSEIYADIYRSQQKEVL